ncbi:MAG: MarR family transcriptional regulator [Deltaproteobacteria bacterium]|nr:MarR family transcriptional regulator [Deltaproteobacteria bacterium]
MKIKHITLKVKTLDEMAADFKRAWKEAGKGKSVREAAETVCFDSVEDMHKFLSPERIRLLKTVHEKTPKSIYELARMLDRDRKNVTEDVKMLEAVGLIERKAAKRGKEKVELVVDYDRIQMDIAV